MVIQSKKVWLADQFVPAAIEVNDGRITAILPYGTKDVDDDYLGGTRKIVANAELLFPFPGMRDNKSLRTSMFVDAGSLWDPKVQGSSMSEELRYSAGLALTWLSPVGPMKFSYAYPIKKKPEDQIQRFQFQLGTTF